jgi:hypothetical protein
MKMITEDDQVFILKGEDEDELYLIDDLAIIAQLDAKIEEMKGIDEAEIGRHLLKIVNPKRYGQE